MANIYVRSTDGNNADNGSTWALAKATLAGAAAIDAVGDTIWVSQNHAETTAGNVSLGWAGTKASPSRIICANDGAEPPTAVASTATVSTTGVSSISFSSSAAGFFYVYGITFSAGSAANNGCAINCISSATAALYESCVFTFGTTGTATLSVGGATNSSSLITWFNCDVKFNAAGQTFTLTGNSNHQFHWNGGSFQAGTSTPTAASSGIFTTSGNASGSQLIENVDFSNLGSTVNIHNGNSSAVNTPFSFVLRNCKLPASWSGNLVRQTVLGCGRYAMYNCSAGSQNYKLWIETAEGTIRDETTIVRSNGATDGTTQLSWKMTAASTAAYPSSYLVSDEIIFFNPDVGSAKTASIHFIHDSATGLTDNDIWIELSYLGSSSAPLGTFINDAAADPLATASTQDTSLETWVTTGMANPNKQKISVSITPQMVGFISARVCLAKASKTIYVCPKVMVE